MEFIFFEGTLVSLSILKILSSSSVEHPIMPVSFVLFMSTFSEKDTPSRLHTVSEITLVPTAIGPPKSTPAVSLSCFKLTLINIAFLSSPSVDSSTLFLIKPKLAYIVIAGSKVELSLALKLPIMEVSIYDFMCIFEEADSFTVGTIDLGLAYIDYLWILEKFRRIEGRF